MRDSVSSITAHELRTDLEECEARPGEQNKFENVLHCYSALLPILGLIAGSRRRRLTKLAA